MNWLVLLDKAIHGVPFLPRKLQGSWIDKVWEKISDKKKGDVYEVQV